MPAIHPRIRAKQRALQVTPRWGDEEQTARRYGLSVALLRKDRARPNPVFPFVKIRGVGRGGGIIRYCWPLLDEIMARSTCGQEEAAPA
jgi:hypothetical protein